MTQEQVHCSRCGGRMSFGTDGDGHLVERCEGNTVKGTRPCAARTLLPWLSWDDRSPAPAVVPAAAAEEPRPPDAEPGTKRCRICTAKMRRIGNQYPHEVCGKCREKAAKAAGPARPRYRRTCRCGRPLRERNGARHDQCFRCRKSAAA